MAERPALIDSFTGEHAFLSNFHEEPFGMWGTTIRTAEHAFQAAKANNAGDMQLVLSAPTPGKAKREGRRIMLRDGWEARKVKVMRDVLRAKFAVPSLRAALLATGSAGLVEGNRWHDGEWGDCRCGRSACARPGRNVLGHLLMELRAQIAVGETVAAAEAENTA